MHKDTNAADTSGENVVHKYIGAEHNLESSSCEYETAKKPSVPQQVSPTTGDDATVERHQGAISDGVKLLGQLETVLDNTGNLSSGQKRPIRFKDAVGRKFTFPYHLCAK